MLEPSYQICASYQTQQNVTRNPKITSASKHSFQVNSQLARIADESLVGDQLTINTTIATIFTNKKTNNKVDSKHHHSNNFHKQKDKHILEKNLLDKPEARKTEKPAATRNQAQGSYM